MVSLPVGGTSLEVGANAQHAGSTCELGVTLSGSIAGTAWDVICGLLELFGYQGLSNGSELAKVLMEGAEVSYSLAMYNLSTSMFQTTEALYQSDLSFGSPALLSAFDAGSSAWARVMELVHAKTPFALSTTDREGIAVSSNAIRNEAARMSMTFSQFLEKYVGWHNGYSLGFMEYWESRTR